MSGVAGHVTDLELADYQKAVRLLLRHPLITTVYPDRAALPLVRRWAGQLRGDLMEVLGYRLVTSAGTARLQRVQDSLDTTRPAVTRAGRPFDRRRYAYLVLAMAALGRHGSQIALGELAEAVAADAVRVDGLGLDTARKADRDAFVDALTWLTERGALALADGSATAWAGDPGRAEALYDVDREVLAAVHQPTRVVQHLTSVTGLLACGSVLSLSAGRASLRRDQARRARRLVLENPVAYYADADPELRGQLRSPSLAEDLTRLTGLGVERRAEGVALVDTSGRLSDLRFPAGGTVAQAALLLSARIAEAALRTGRHAPVLLPAPTAAERLAARARSVDAALPAHGLLAELAGLAAPGGESSYGTTGMEAGEGSPERDEEGMPEETRYPFVTDSWLRGRIHEIIGEYGRGFAADLREDPDRLLARALDLLSAMALVTRVDGGVLALPLLARYRGVTAKVRPRTAPPKPPGSAGEVSLEGLRPALFAEPSMASSPDPSDGTVKDPIR
ncbi:TIGR02678 family protein [Streptomyces olivoreticuli]